MLSQLVALGVVLKIRRREPAPVNHTLFYYGCKPDGAAQRPRFGRALPLQKVYAMLAGGGAS